jgi:hypothetical protein
MAYTAYGRLAKHPETGTPASGITPMYAVSDDLITWERIGPVVEGEDNKDHALFPERVGGRCVTFHRRPPRSGSRSATISARGGITSRSSGRARGCGTASASGPADHRSGRRRGGSCSTTATTTPTCTAWGRPCWRSTILRACSPGPRADPGAPGDMGDQGGRPERRVRHGQPRRGRDGVPVLRGRGPRRSAGQRAPRCAAGVDAGGGVGTPASPWVSGLAPRPRLGRGSN